MSAFVAGGMIGNTLDRIRLGSVRDFLVTPWAIVNIADIAVAAGIIGVVVTLAAHAPATANRTGGRQQCPLIRTDYRTSTEIEVRVCRPADLMIEPNSVSAPMGNFEPRPLLMDIGEQFAPVTTCIMSLPVLRPHIRRSRCSIGTRAAKLGF